MTNPGHIDPGYKGRMSFTLVNMAQEPYSLIPGAAICSVLLFKLAQPPARDYESRRRDEKSEQEGTPSSADSQGVTRQNLLDKLAPDFLQFEERAERIAQRTIRDAEFKIKLLQVWIPVIAAVIALIGSVALSFFTFFSGLENRVTKLEANVQETEERSNLEDRIQALESSLKSLQEAR